jgi:uncharacterized membrane protein
MDYPDCAIDVICEIGARLRQTNLLVTQRASRNVNRVMEEQYSVGQRVADRLWAGRAWCAMGSQRSPALQAPVIMMSQNRAAEDSRISNVHGRFIVNGDLAVEQVNEKLAAR